MSGWAADSGWDDGETAVKETSYGNDNAGADFGADPAADPAAGGKENYNPDGQEKEGSCRK
ncbi:hypothetical protein Plec18170_007596 [Paecilomyces lecythidis]